MIYLFNINSFINLIIPFSILSLYGNIVNIINYVYHSIFHSNHDMESNDR